MLEKRIIPVLQMTQSRLVKTTNFKDPSYIGDPCNTGRIFNELEVDELIILDIRASEFGHAPDFATLQDLASECFMPLAYGGAVTSLPQVKQIFDLGYEKIILNSALHDNPNLIDEVAKHYGSQAVIVSMDVVKGLLGKQTVSFKSAKEKSKKNPVEWARECAMRGAGELMVTSVMHEGSWQGYAIDLMAAVANAVDIPVIAYGGAGKVDDIKALFSMTNVRAAAAGNLFVYQKKGMGVLVNFPDISGLDLT
ncbi:HisA/HisF-related TIM barrel protein [Alphaproteobacteria bacterium]|nr:HisA/HisF-related TIM barrel protein [Alphaproteobacteria bacterium]